MTNSISVIIPSYNSFRTIERVLSTIESQSYKTSIEEIIVVDSSDDIETRVLLKGIHLSQLKTVFLQKKTSPACGRNIGAGQASGEILCFIDSDTELSSDWVERVVANIKAGVRIGGGAVAVSPEQKGKWLVWAQYFLQLNEFMDVSSKRKVPFVPSCNLFCDRKLFEEVGGFPEIRAAEDVLFGLNANKLTDVWFLPQARVCHIFREDLKGFLRNQSLIGKYVMIYRRQRSPDAFFYKGAWPFFLLPGFLFVKFAKITIRIMRANFSYFLKYLIVLPAVLLGLICWGYGFAQGIFSDEK